MPARIRGDFRNISARIAQAGGRITKAVNDQLEQEALELQKLARDMTPREHGNMENAITVENSDRRRRWVVFVDENKPDDTGKYTVGDYLNYLHEGIMWNELGEASIAKQATVTAVVGPKFLERAYRERVRSGMLKRIREAARQSGVL